MKFCVGISLFFIMIAVLHANEVDRVMASWSKASGAHFEVYYPHEVGSLPAERILATAEMLYNRLNDRLGFSRYQDYWTWEKRVKIVLYENAQEFSHRTGQPAWAEGFAASHEKGSFQGRFIVSYQGQENFLSEILPHEIGHLMMHDFMNHRDLPQFFDEGVAQLEQQRDDQEHRPLMAKIVAQHKHVSFKDLVVMRLDSHTEMQTASIFYAESLYIVDFLIKTYGKDKFVQICRLLRDGLSFEEAVKKACYPNVQGLENLEEQWVNSMLVFLS